VPLSAGLFDAGANREPADGTRTRIWLAYLFITHDLRMAAHLADEIAVMSGGKIVEQGSAEQIARARASGDLSLLAASGMKSKQADTGVAAMTRFCCEEQGMRCSCYLVFPFWHSCLALWRREIISMKCA